MSNIITGQAWSVYYPEIALRCSGVPEPIMDHFLRDASREFLRRTLMWQPAVGPVGLTAAQSLYGLADGLVASVSGADWPVEAGLAPMECEQMIRVFYANAYGAGEIKETTTKWLEANEPGWPFRTAQYPSRYFMVGSIAGGQGIRLYPTPTTTIADAFWVAPALSNPTVVGGSSTALNFDFNPELPFKYKRDIAAGAVARLAAMTKRPWFDATTAMMAQADFEEGISRKRLKVIKDGTRARVVARGSNAGFA